MILYGLQHWFNDDCFNKPGHPLQNNVRKIIYVIHWVGRIRGQDMIRHTPEGHWLHAKSLHPKATAKPVHKGTIESLTGLIPRRLRRKIFRSCPHVKKQLWGGEFWSDGYFASTVGKHGDEDMIKKYVRNQGKEYTKLHDDKQLALF